MSSLDRTSRTEPSEDGLSEVVHELFAAGLDLYTALGLLPGHVDQARRRVCTAISRLDYAIRAIRDAETKRALEVPAR